MANKQNLRPQPFTSETGRKAQKKSVSKRKENQTTREAVKNILMQTVTDKEQLNAIKKAGLPIGTRPTYLDYLVASIIMRTAQKGRVEDLLKLMDVLGEERDISSHETLDKAREILGAVESVID